MLYYRSVVLLYNFQIQCVSKQVIWHSQTKLSYFVTFSENEELKNQLAQLAATKVRIIVLHIIIAVRSGRTVTIMMIYTVRITELSIRNIALLANEERECVDTINIPVHAC